MTEIDEATWKHVVVRMDNPDGSDDILEIELLRSPQWIEETGSRVGGSIGLAIPEMGIYGWAKVIALNPCPKLQTGAGRVVTMTITHFNAFVLRFKIEGLPEVLEPTILHPLYSEDRGEWVHAGELKVGERLRTKTGPARIEAISHKEGTYRVYNFEVEETHAYYTSTSKVLSHNSGAMNCAPTDGNIVFRAIRPSEVSGVENGVGIVRGSGNTTAVQHVGGVPNHPQNPWVSTTRSLESARFFATEGGTKQPGSIIVIDLSKVTYPIVDISTAQLAVPVLGHPRYVNFAVRHQEVLIKGGVNPEAIIGCVGR